MLKSSLCDYSYVYRAVKGTITVPNNKNKDVVFKKCAPFTDSIVETNNTQIDHAKEIYVVMNM